MPDKIYLCLFVLCGIWSQGITGSFADEKTSKSNYIQCKLIWTETDKSIEESSDILVRQKRVVNQVPGEDHSITMSLVPYIVRIKLNTRIHCVGSILSHYVAITSSLCVTAEHPSSQPSVYQVVSGNGHLDNKGTIHNVLNIRKHFGNHPRRPLDGIALLIVDPPFVYGSTTDYIKLHSGALLPGTLGTISGWGFNFRCNNPGTRYQRSLRSIVVPVIAHRDCVNRYQPQIGISEKDICTYHLQKHCGHNDGGAPLVVDGHLAGVHLWTGLDKEQNDHRYPDVFASLQHSEYNQWIRTNVQNIEAQFQHRN